MGDVYLPQLNHSRCKMGGMGENSFQGFVCSEMSYVRGAVPGRVQCSLPQLQVTLNWTTSQTIHTFLMKSLFMLFPQPPNSPYSACQNLTCLWGSIQIPLPPWKFLNHQALLCGPHTFLKTPAPSFLHYVCHLCTINRVTLFNSIAQREVQIL